MAVDMMNSQVLSNLLQTPNPAQQDDPALDPALSAGRVIDQPIEARLKYGSSFHAEILSRLNARQRLAEKNIASRWDDWNRVDESCALYIDLARNVRTADKGTRSNKKEMPWERAIVVPMSYAILQTYLTQLLAIFTKRDPILEISGSGPEDMRSAKVMQAVIGYDQRETNFLVQLYTILQDAVKYGMGTFYDCWTDKYGWKFTKRPPNPFQDFLGVPPVERTWDLLKQHNSVEAVDPRLTWVDPRVSISNGQKAEFAGHRAFCSYLELLEGAQKNGGPYFNIEYVSKLGAGGISRRDTTVARSLKHLQMTGSMDDKDKGFHCKDVMSIKLIPKDWKLGDGERPEVWQFAWIDKSIVIRAHPSEYEHQELPYSGAESNVDTHVTFNPGAIENLDGLQRFMNWFYNCADEQTEILTSSGFKFLKDLDDGDKVATVDPNTHEFWFEAPRQHFVYPFDGEMVRVKTDQQDMLVTPNHQMYVGTCTEGNHRFRFKDAAAIDHRCKFLGAVSQNGGIENGELVLEEETRIYANGGSHTVPLTSIPYSTLAPFLGYFVSEGNCYIREYQSGDRAKGITSAHRITIGQSKESTAEKIAGVMESMPFHVTRAQPTADLSTWTISNWRLAKWLKEHCGDSAQTKRVPACVFTWGPELRGKFLDAAIDGDGHKKTENYAQYYSASKELADGIQAIAVSLGYKTVLGQSLSNGKTLYCVSINKRTKTFALQPWSFSREYYKGEVYCIENSTHLTIYRRNGKVGIHGQSHVANVMRHLNNSMLYSPTLVEELDILNPTAAGHYRLSALGEKLLQEGRISMDAVIHQLQKVDVTSGMLGEVNQLFDWGMRMTGASDAMQAQVTSDKRTLGEINQANMGASARMSFYAQLIDSMAIFKMAQRWISNRQQFTDKEGWFRVSGEFAREMASTGDPRYQNGFMMVTPDDLAGNVDYVPRSGPMPADPGDSIQAWTTLSEMLSKSPMLLQMPDAQGRVPDVQELFKEFARTPLGIRNIDSFYKPLMPPPGMGMPGQMPPGAPGTPQVPVRVLPDEQVAQMRQAGNVIPLKGAA